jgi:molybdopterin/thiamine biosynthesis adenylyltransferase/proteasome lid subunit RPN8/RPN11
MTSYSVTLRDEHLTRLKAHLLHEDECERAAYVICNKAAVKNDPWDRTNHLKLLVVDVVPVPDEHIIESTPSLVSWSTASFVRALKRTGASGQVLGIVHNHPTGMAWFSEQDDRNEPDLAQLSVNRNGENTPLLSLIFTADGELAGRVWIRPNTYEQLRAVRVVGTSYQFHYPKRSKTNSPRQLHRQALAFGHALNGDLRTLRIGIIGCGGTGSAVAMLLARLGVGHIVVIDDDIVDDTNLNRLHGSRQADADAMQTKVATVAHNIAELGLGVKVVAIEAWVGDPQCKDSLRSCDIIFGCTDDHDGRLLLNRLAYYYLIPVIDMGLAIEVGAEDVPSIKALDGRVTVLSPGHTCLLCRDVITPDIAFGEALRRANPEEYERRKAEAYVVGAGDPSPAVVTFTTELACVAINELIHRMQGFRGADGHAANRVRKFHLGEDRLPRHDPRPNCPLCASATIWGQGDVEPFLGRVG